MNRMKLIKIFLPTLILFICANFLTLEKLLGSEKFKPLAPKVISQLTILPSEDSQPTFMEFFAQLDQLHLERHIGNNAQKELDLVTTLTKQYPLKYDVLWRYARSASWMAESAYNAGHSDRAKNLGLKGYQIGFDASKLKPKRVEAYYYGSISLGLYARSIGILTAIFKGIEGKFEFMIKRAIAIDPQFNGAGPLTTFGRYYYELPWPKRDLAKSIQLLEKSIGYSPVQVRAIAYLADSAWAFNEKQNARKLYMRCANLSLDNTQLADAQLFRPYCKSKL